MSNFESASMGQNEGVDPIAEAGVFTELIGQMEAGQEELEQLSSQAEQSRAGVLGTLEDQIALMRQLKVPAELVDLFDHDLKELRRESDSWWGRLAKFRTRLAEGVKEWLDKK